MADPALSWRPVRRRRAGTRRPAASTPRRLRLLSTLISAAAVALTVIGVGALVVADVTVVVVQQRTVPAIFGMQRVHAWLSDADRSAANAYLAGGAEVTLPQLQYEADVAAAGRELQMASEHNPGGPDASQRLQRIITQVDQYVALVQTASVDDRLGVAAGTVYLQAGSNLMHRPGTGILAQVDALRAIYADALDGANRTLLVTAWMAPLYAAVAFALLVLLVGTQRFVSRRFHRRQNPWLLAATLLLAVVSAAGGAGAVQAARSIRTADGQTYVRLVRLWDARALVYDANGNESLSLIGRQSSAGSSASDAAFAAETAELADRPLTDDLVQRARQGRVAFNGLLADELRSADTPAERSAAIQVLLAYRTFLATDAMMRARSAEGSQAEAVTLALGTDRGQLTFAFGDLDWYLGVATQRLQDRFDATVGSAERVLAVTAGLGLLVLLVVYLTVRGLRPRIDEYRAGGPRRG
jgi:endonuclease/exonuclease/phosphatase (EEP) superfamily protein YafD